MLTRRRLFAAAGAALAALGLGLKRKLCGMDRQRLVSGTWGGVRVIDCRVVEGGSDAAMRGGDAARDYVAEKYGNHEADFQRYVAEWHRLSAEHRAWARERLAHGAWADEDPEC